MSEQVFYPIAVEYVGPNDHGPLEQRIRFLRAPGRTNMSREERVDGCLGTTGDWSQTALGEMNASAARKLLKKHGVKIPRTSAVRYDDYSYGYDGTDDIWSSEEWNHRNVY